MSSIPANIGRTSSLLTSTVQLSNINRSNLELFRVQNQLSTGRLVIRPSDDAAKASTIGVLDDRIERSAQVLRNLDQADARYALIETALAETNDFVLQAKSIASNQVNLGTTRDQRRDQALLVASILDGALDTVNTEQDNDFLFGGSRISSAPFSQFGTGIRYTGETDRLLADLGLGAPAPVTLSGATAVGSDLARVRGDVDLDPDLTPGTRLVDVGNGSGAGVTLGPVEFRLTGLPAQQVDLTGAETIEDVTTRLEAAIREYESANAVTVLGPGGVGVSGKSITIDVAAPVPAELTFDNVGEGSTASDLGLQARPVAGTPIASVTPVVFSGGLTPALDLEPRVTLATPVSALAGLSGPLEAIRISNAGRSAIVDLSAAVTVEDVKSAIESAGVGVRVEVNSSGDGINIVNEVSAAPGEALSISEVAGGADTATALGIRTLSTGTRLETFNDGRGVGVVSGATDPLTGLPDPARDVDFEVTLGDGTTFSVDLRPQDATTVGTVIARINAQAAAAGIAVPGDFEAGLTDGDNGIALRQNGGFAGPITITRQNNSPAPEQLGLLDGTYDAGGAILAGGDRAKVVVDSLFSRLLGLQRALESDDTAGITLAGEKLEGIVDQVAQSRGLVGGYSRRVESAVRREEDLVLVDEQVRSELRDLDFAEGATRLTQLQTQLQAGLQTAAVTQQLSLLNFLG